MKSAVFFGAIAAILAIATAADATPCRDAKGHFVKCTAPAPTTAKPTHCRDAKGHFVKCGIPGAK
jgi:hypothetical protein